MFQLLREKTSPTDEYGLFVPHQRELVPAGTLGLDRMHHFERSHERGSAAGVEYAADFHRVQARIVGECNLLCAVTVHLGDDIA